MTFSMKRAVIILCSLFILISCGGQHEKYEKDKIYTFTASDIKLFMHIGDVIEVTVSDYPEEYQNKWDSMNNSVATVDWKGNITAMSVGETDVVVSNPYPNQELSKVIRVHVMPDDVYTFRSSYIRMIPVKGGTYTMGKEDYPLNPAREVTVQDFQLAEFEITQQLWADIMNKDFREYYNEDFPVARVYDVWESEFLPELCSMTGKPFRFPTEAEWEYAARAGEETVYSGGDKLDELGWYKGSPDTGWDPFNNNNVNRPVMHFKPNAWGFYDMSGNVAEWVSDVIDNPSFAWDDLNQEDIEYQKELLNPGSHIAKGGSVLSPAGCCTVWSRESLFSLPESHTRIGPFGLRVAL